MSKRVISIITPGMYLCEKDRQLEIWQNQERISKVPIEDLGLLMLENNAVTVTGKLLGSLSTAGVTVSLCDHYHLPSALLIPLTGVSIHALRTRALVELSKPRQKKAWQQIVTCKINFQAQVICDNRHESGVLKRLASEVESGDTGNNEATAARLYWQTIFNQIEQGFTRSGESKLNGLLNYGYAILRSSVARSLVGAGLTPIFGVFHKSRDNYFALADDFLEVYRPFVDLWIKNNYLRSPELFEEKKFKKEILRILTTQVKMNRETKSILQSIDEMVESFVSFVEGSTEKLKFPDVCEFLDTV